MLQKTEGIIFKVTKYRETSVICKIYTRKWGMLAFIANGVRKISLKSSASIYQPLHIVQLNIYYNSTREIQRIKDIKISEIYSQIPFNVVRSSTAIFLLEVLDKCIQESSANHTLFDEIKSAFIQLDEAPFYPNMHLRFLLQLTAYLGFLPYGRYRSSNPYFDLQANTYTPKKPTHLMYIPPSLGALWDTLLHSSQTVSINREYRKQLLDYIIQYYRLHIPAFGQLKSRMILETIFS